ncbi:MAG TPA: protease pro-enzyme activation domain-containing protein [Actinocrinis sp.]|nr:protease pro-enzyme activation domain-containing protein [Actinocrinis sp.]
MRTSTSRRRAAAASAAAFALAAVGLVAASPVQAATSSVSGAQALVGSQPTWATPQADRGTAASSTAVTADVYLASSNAQGLAAYAQAVSDPKSPQYHQYLTPAQQNARFGATPAQVSAVRAWLTSSGLKVTASTEQYLAISGTAAAVHAAFDTTLDNFSVSGHTYFAPKSSAVVPAAVSSYVLGSPA